MIPFDALPPDPPAIVEQAPQEQLADDEAILGRITFMHRERQVGLPVEYSIHLDPPSASGTATLDTRPPIIDETKMRRYLPTTT